MLRLSSARVTRMQATRINTDLKQLKISENQRPNKNGTRMTRMHATRIKTDLICVNPRLKIRGIRVPLERIGTRITRMQATLINTDKICENLRLKIR